MIARRLVRLALVAIVTGIVLPLVALAAVQDGALSETARLKVQVHQLKVENARLRSALATLQAELDSERLSDERAALEQQLRDEIKPPAGATFDWTTGAFVTPHREPPK